MLKFDNVSFQYDVEDFSIIDHLSFDVQDGEFVSVIGASGCGKSTIFRLVNKLLLPASGEILVDGESIERKRNYCGYMPQQDLLFHIKSNLNHCRKILGRTEPLMNNRQTRRKAIGNHGGSSAEGNLSKETETGLFLQP